MLRYYGWKFASSVKHSKKTIEISSEIFWILILHEVYSQASVLVSEDANVSTFSHLHIPKSALNDPIVFPAVGCISDAMLNLVSPKTSILLKYKSSMESTSTGVIPKKMTFRATEGTSTDSQFIKKKSKAKPKAVEKEASTKNVPEKYGKGYLRKLQKKFPKKSVAIGFEKDVENVIK